MTQENTRPILIHDDVKEELKNVQCTLFRQKYDLIRPKPEKTTVYMNQLFEMSTYPTVKTDIIIESGVSG